MKLLIIMPTQSRGGVEEHALMIGTTAIDRGWSVEAAFPQVSGIQSLIDEFESVGIAHHSLAIGETVVFAASTLTELVQTLRLRIQAWVEKPWHLLQVLVCLLRSRPDVVMVNLSWADKGFTSLLACAILNQPTTVVFHLIPWQLELSGLKLKVYQWIYDRHQTWIGISENNRQLISKSFQLPLDKVVRIYNGTAFHEHSLLPHNRDALRQKIRQTLGLPDHSIILLTVARLDRQKGHDYLIPAIPHLLESFPNIHFVWVGDGDQKENLEHQLDNYGIRSSVSLLGYRQDIPNLLLAADLFILPTYFEGFPFALLEAMACGLPVVTTHVNGIPEIIEHGVHGLLTRKGDSCDLLETLRWALANPEDMAIMASSARRKVQEFSQEKMLTETLEVLKKVANGARQN